MYSDYSPFIILYGHLHRTLTHHVITIYWNNSQSMSFTERKYASSSKSAFELRAKFIFGDNISPPIN